MDRRKFIKGLVSIPFGAAAMKLIPKIPKIPKEKILEITKQFILDLNPII